MSSPDELAGQFDRAAGTIPNRSYFDPSALADELTGIFRCGWLFAGMVSELANNHDFVRLDLPDDSIVVQNFRGELRAFQNICTHRSNIIQTQDRGNRRLTCGYHGWTFDAEGLPLAMGERQGFLARGEDRSRLCLTRYRVETCGAFVFVARDEAALGLGEYLGDFASTLIELSGYLGDETHFGVVPHAANWKLLVENVLECYHCAAVHPDTFVAGLGVGRKPIADVRFAGAGARRLHSSSHFPRVPIKREALRRQIMAHLDARPFQHESFFHVFVFPNLFISSTEGVNFYVGQALPRSPDTTDLRVRFLEPKLDLDASGRRRQDAINPQGVELGLRVIEEDRAILEAVQRGMSIAKKPPCLGHEEARLAAFHEAYRNLIAA